MRNRILIALFASVCCVFLMASCGGGGGGGGTPVAPCANCISVDTPTVAFGDVLQNGVLEKTILVQNIGTGSLIIGQIAGSNPVAAPFQIWSDKCSSTTLATSQICELKVRFSPTVPGSGLSDTFNIPSNDPNTVTVSLSGNGIAPPTPPPPTPPPPASINVSSTQIAFGEVEWNSSSTQTITVKNTGSLNLVIGNIAPPALPFSISSDACSGLTLGANATCALVARFSPTSPNAFVADSFDIPSNDSIKPSVAVIVSGTGKSPAAPPPPTPPPPTINVSSNNLSFGNVVWDITSQQTISVQNTAAVGSANLVVGQVAQVNPLAAPFSISTDNCSGKSLAPTATCPLVVQFSPTTQGAGLIDSFDIPSNDPITPSVRVDVGGNGRGLRVSINDATTNSCPDNIALRISVSDKGGTPVAGLSQADVALSENGVAKATTGFSPDLSPTPVSVALTLDYSGSLQVALDNVKTASKGFIDQLQVGDEAAVFVFSETVTRMQSFTDNQAALKLAIDSGPTGFFTALYDALWTAIDNVSAFAKPGNNRAIILISDGIDNNASTKTLAEVLDYAVASNTSIFTIGMGRIVNTEVMTTLANVNGGQYYPAPDSAQLGSIYAAIRNIIDGAYTVTYSSSVAPGGSALLDVFVISGALQGEVSRTVPRCP